jgi:hypothetical protein
MKVYDPDQVSVIAFGILIEGWADGEFITIENESEAFTDKIGTDGEVSRSKSNDDRATATIKLMQTSSSNALLTGVYQLDRALPNGAGVGSFMVRDRQGTSLYAAAEAWIQKVPDVSFDREATTREWKIRLAKVNHFTGGN